MAWVELKHYLGGGRGGRREVCLFYFFFFLFIIYTPGPSMTLELHQVRSVAPLQAKAAGQVLPHHGHLLDGCGNGIVGGLAGDVLCLPLLLGGLVLYLIVSD